MSDRYPKKRDIGRGGGSKDLGYIFRIGLLVDIYGNSLTSSR